MMNVVLTLCSPPYLVVGPIPRDSISHVWVALPAPIKADETTPHRYTRDCLLCGSLSSWWSTLAITLCAHNNSNMSEPPKPRQQQDHLERILQSPHNEDKVIETKLTPLKHQEKQSKVGSFETGRGEILGIGFKVQCTLINVIIYNTHTVTKTFCQAQTIIWSLFLLNNQEEISKPPRGLTKMLHFVLKETNSY